MIEMTLIEALENAVVHGNCKDPHKRVYVTCSCTAEGEVSITVQDEGQGFDTGTLPIQPLRKIGCALPGAGSTLIRQKALESVMHAPAKARSRAAALIGPLPCACVDTYFPTALARSAWHVLLVRIAIVSTSSAISDFCTSSNCGRIFFTKSTGAWSGALPARYQSRLESCRKTRKAFMQNMTMQTSHELSISEVRILSLASIGGALEF
jgi:hypothetical protein